MAFLSSLSLMPDGLAVGTMGCLFNDRLVVETMEVNTQGAPKSGCGKLLESFKLNPTPGGRQSCGFRDRSLSEQR